MAFVSLAKGGGVGAVGNFCYICGGLGVAGPECDKGLAWPGPAVITF